MTQDQRSRGRLGWRGAARRHTFELAVSVVFVLVGTSYLIDPNGTVLRSAVGHVVGLEWVRAWSALYVVAGPTILYGLVWSRWNIRLAGLLLMATALVMNGVVAVAGQPEVRDLTFFIYAAACILRAALLVRRAHRGP